MASPHIEFTKEQRDFLNLKVTQGDLLLRGGAGTGKTLCAVEYTKDALRVEQENLFYATGRVGLLTFTKALVGELKGIRAFKGRDEDAVTINTIDSFVFHQIGDTLEARGLNTRVREDQLLHFVEMAKAAVFEAGDTSALAQKGDEFFLEEIRWIKGNELNDLESYCKIKRTGRSLNERVTRENRAKIWEVYVEYARLLREASYWDFLDRQAFLLHLLETGEVEPMFRHLTVDEVQDCSRLTIRMLKRLVIPGGTFLLVGDAAQKIYRNSFSWKSVGVHAQGRRTTVLKQNHRNTRQIYRLGAEILAKVAENAEFTEVLSPTTEGPIPVCYYADRSANLDRLVSLLKAVPKNQSCVVALPTNEALERWDEELSKQGVTVTDLRQKDARSQSGLFISTFHSLKGLSVDKVVLLGIEAAEFPVATSGEERTRDLQLLHTAVTRARQEVTLLVNSTLTSYLETLPETVLQRVYTPSFVLEF